MNNLSRHIACKLCRDRKVRCDGGQPSCEKCRRSGETCVYVPTHKPTKADLAHTIESLQERLDKAEAYILRHSNTNKPATTSEQQPITTPVSAIGIEYPDCSPFSSLQMPTALPTGDAFMPAGVHGIPPTPFPHHHHALPMSPETLDSELMSYMHSPHLGLPHDPSQYQMEDPGRIEDVSAAAAAAAAAPFRRESVYSHGRMPSLREVRMVNGSTASTTSPPPSPSGRGYRTDDANHILAELTAFGMVVFNTQAEIAGISSVVAEYLEWMRRAQPTNSSSGGGGGGGMTDGSPESSLSLSSSSSISASAVAGGQPAEPNPAVLEALETRVRELNALAGSRHLEAWRQSVHRLERIPGVGAMLGLFDSEMQRRSGETAEFFHTRYDVCSPLAEQLGRRES